MNGFREGGITIITTLFWGYHFFSRFSHTFGEHYSDLTTDFPQKVAEVAGNPIIYFSEI